MSEPKIFAKQPAVVELEAGTYHWCKCGLSAKQPFCDGSHKATDITPIAFEFTEKKQAALCQCKHTANPPYCDGSHAML